MTDKEILKIIKNKIKTDELIELSRYDIDDCSVLANPCVLSEKFLLIQQIGDFCTDGYKIIRNSDINEIRLCEKNETLKFTDMIFKKENIFGSKPEKIDLSSWQSVFEAFQKNGKSIMVECAYDDAIDYYFGKVKSVNNNIAQMICFDGAGVLFESVVKINTNYVSGVTFDDRYTSLMSKYIIW